MSDSNDSKSDRSMKAVLKPSALATQESEGEDAHAPVSRKVVMADLREAIFASADHIMLMCGNRRVAEDFLGIAIADLPTMDRDAIDLERFEITNYINKAYDFAFQVGRLAHRHDIDEYIYQCIMTLRHRSPDGMWGAGGSPVRDDNSPISIALDTADARKRLLWGDPITVRQLALLARMTEPAVRTSLSKEGIKTEKGKPSMVGDATLSSVPTDIALRWLSGRRGFMPTRKLAPIDPGYLDDLIRLLKDNGFEDVLKGHIPFLGGSLQDVALRADVGPDWLLEVATGRPAKADVDALTRVARCLCVDEPPFVGRAVQLILQASKAPSKDSESSLLRAITGSLK